ncbi:MAG: hypothetical protein J5898_08725, partial [Lachnospiraceae bacterium]|nr:hypothetical protein [Lachnospiraceae bacterium]
MMITSRIIQMIPSGTGIRPESVFTMRRKQISETAFMRQRSFDSLDGEGSRDMRADKRGLTESG